ncbi:hypothetical protein EDD53_1128 [Pacificibacter maritimus]|uniref:Uncharacterized protein n=1 Tax=Pacificibacter maritimus TaxID=762213 RepID=A0A3N4UN06_9RHOB|nr:hypothetical protein EDD53_1128 [Pacificibacter maritimus]
MHVNAVLRLIKLYSEKVAGDRSSRSSALLPKPDIIRWAPGNWTRIQTEPAPFRLLKATGVLRPYVRTEQIPPLT